MPKKADEMGERIYEHYLRYGKSKKKLRRKAFSKRYGYGLKRRSSRTRKAHQDIGTGLTAADKRRMTD